MENKKSSKKSGKSQVPAPVAPAKAISSEPSAVKRKLPPAAAQKTSKSKKTTHRHLKTPAPPSAITAVVSNEEVSRLAYRYWEERNYAHGFADQDWLRAEHAVRSHSRSTTERTG